MGSLYHYCTVETLKAIIENKTLRLSDISKSNDSKEIDFLFDEYCKWVINSKDNQNDSLMYANSIKFFKKEQLDCTTFLVLCFSRKEDDLHMWNCYGNEGVSIEFDEDNLKDYFKNTIGVGVDEELNEKIVNLKSSPIKMELKDVKYYNSKTIVNYFKDRRLNSNVKDFSKIINDSPFCKNKFFKCEKEVRLVFVWIHNSELPNYLSFLDRGIIKEKICFKSISNDKYSHKMVIDIPIQTKLIKSIRLAPNCKMTIKDIKELLFINGIEDDIEIQNSSGTYR